ncbi:hypothetical protein F4604DRAFT_1571293, partial [Suillus subluteus]
PCTADGVFLAPGVPPTPLPPKSHNDWSPYHNNIEFATAEFAFKQHHMSNAAADTLFDLMAALLAKHNDSPPFADHKDLHQVIDTTQLGDVPWQGFSVQYTGERPENAPSWMDDEYDVWYRDPHLMAHNMLANPTYKKEIDYTPFREYDVADDTRRWKDFMSGDWAWEQAASHSYNCSNWSKFLTLVVVQNSERNLPRPCYWTRYKQPVRHDMSHSVCAHMFLTL